MSETTKQKLESLFQSFGLTPEEARIAVNSDGMTQSDPTRQVSVLRDLDLMDEY
jgi:hypothetical protein